MSRHGPERNGVDRWCGMVFNGGMTTVEALTDHMVEAVRFDFESEPDRYAEVRSWTDLHDVCDANEYVIEACEAFDVSLNVLDDAAMAIINEATDRAEARLFPVR